MPGVAESLAQQVVDFVQALRTQELYKAPGVAETLDWAEALGHLNQTSLKAEMVERTLGIDLEISG